MHPDNAVRTPHRYASFIRASLGELCCGEPMYRNLHTRRVSDRTVCYLASGRLAVCEETGFEDEVSAGEGLLAVESVDEAAATIDLSAATTIDAAGHGWSS